MIRPTRSLVAVLALAGIAGLSACGDTSDTGDGSATTTSSAAPAGGAAGEAADCDGAAGETVTVEIGDFVFDPDTVEVSACDEIVWSNVHDQAHTSTGSGDFDWSTGNIKPGTEADPIVFTTPGTYAYMCALHPFMQGTVEVS